MNKMRFAIIPTCLVLLTSLNLLGQPKREKGGEFFAGYALTRMDYEGMLSDRGLSTDAGGINFNGFNAAYTRHLVHTSVTDTVGLKLDIGGTFGEADFGNLDETVRIWTVAAGPVFTNRSHEYLQPYVHALFGAGYIDGSLGAGIEDDAGFAFILGGGLDLKFSERLAYRIGQLDYQAMRHDGTTINNFRFGTGLTMFFE